MSLRERLSSGEPEPLQPAVSAELMLIWGKVHQRVVAQLAEEQGEQSLAAAAAESGAIRQRILAVAGEILDRENPALGQVQRQRALEAVCDEILAYGPISPLLRDNTISEVMVNGPHQVYIERDGKVSQVPIRFRDSRHVMAVVEKILAPLGRRVDESSPMVDARLADGSRVNVIIPPVCLGGPAMTIRKFKEEGLSMERLTRLGALTPEMAQFLRCCVESRLNILVTGGTASGKTTMLNALSDFIPAHERIITIEDAAELRLRQGHVLSLESRPPNAEGHGEVTIRSMLRNALRMRPDRIVIGEVRGGEALDLLQAMNTGHEGCLSTLHANKPRDAIARLETMALMANLDLPVRVIRDQIAAAVDMIVHLERCEDGSRRVAYIAEVQGMEGEVITLHEVFHFERIGVAPDGTVQGQFRRSAVRPAALERFRRFGVSAGAWRHDGAEGAV